MGAAESKGGTAGDSEQKEPFLPEMVSQLRDIGCPRFQTSVRLWSRFTDTGPVDSDQVNVALFSRIGRQHCFKSGTVEAMHVENRDAVGATVDGESELSAGSESEGSG